MAGNIPDAAGAPGVAAPAAETVSTVPPTAVEPVPSAGVVTPAPAEGTSTPTAEPAAEPAAIKPHTDEPGLFGDEAKPAEGEAAPKLAEGEGEAPKAEGDAAGEGAQPPAPEPIVYETLQVPQGVTLQSERIAEADTVLRELGIDNAGRQRLYDLYMQERAGDGARDLQSWHDTFAETRRGWRQQAAGDAEIGGAGFETSRAAANYVIQTLYPDAAERTRALEGLHSMGATDHPEVMRLLVRAARYIHEPADGPAPRTPNPPPNANPRPRGMGNGAPDGWYTNTRSS